MAIIEGSYAVPGLEVTIKSNGDDLVEYADDEIFEGEGELEQFQAERTVTKYVESRTGEEFSVDLRVEGPYQFTSDALMFELSVDGYTIPGSPLVLQSTALPHTHSSQGSKFQDALGAWKLQKFKFSAILISSDDYHIEACRTDATRMKHIGEIVVRVHRVSGLTKSTKAWAATKFATHPNTVHEKALKGQARSHGTTLGEIEATAATSLFTSAKVDGEDRPIAIFKFKYRSKEALQSLRIIEREPEDDHDSVSPDDEADTDTISPGPDATTAARILKLEGELAALRNGGRGIKRAGSNSQISSKRIKQEGSHTGSSRRTIKLEAGIVDLTED